MVRPKRHSDAEVLRTAREIFVERGPAASLATIAARLGLSQPALSKRFGSKRELLVRALVPPSHNVWLDRLAAGPDERDFTEQLRELSVAAMDILDEAVPSMMTLRLAGLKTLQAIAGGVELPHEQVQRAVVAYFERARAKGLLRDVDAENVAMMFIGALQARALLAYVHGVEVDPEQRVENAHAVADLLLRGAQSEVGR